MTTSSDGFLTATANAPLSGVDLVVNVTGLPVATMNLVANPNSEAAGAFALFTNATGPNSATQAHTGTKSTALTAASAATMAGISPAFPVAAGQAYAGSLWLRPNATARSSSAAIRWLDSTGATLSTTTGTASTETGAAWKQYTVTGTAPAGAVSARLIANVTSPANAEVHFVDDLQVEPGSTVTTYCDGTQAGCRWAGAANNSISVRDPIGNVVVTRAPAGGVAARVRGLDNVPAPGGGATGFDHEAPLGVLCTYQASIYSTAGVLVMTTTTATATVAAAAYVVWLKSLSNPALSVAVRVMAFPAWAQDIAEGVFRVMGRANPVTVDDVRQSGTGTMVLKTNTTAEIAALRALLAAPGPYLLSSALAAEDDVYVSVAAHTRTRMTMVASDGLRTVQLPMTQVDRPATSGVPVAIPTHTYADSTTALPLYSNRTGLYSARA